MPDGDSPISFVTEVAVKWVTGTVGYWDLRFEILGQLFKPTIRKELKYFGRETPFSFFSLVPKFSTDLKESPSLKKSTGEERQFGIGAQLSDAVLA
jgi:hypothetical protein